MPIVVTLRDVGTAAIVVGLLITLFTLASVDSDRPFFLAGLIVLVGIGLRIEAALRTVVTQRVETLG
jgi:cell division protein FtsW (lipid II flippase)